MASTGKKGRKNKGTTFALTDFLANTKKSWNNEVDEAERLIEFNRKPALPAAPRAARAAEFDETRIQKNPPYIAYLSNLSYEVEERDISEFFMDLNIANVRLPRDDRTERLKGFGYVEFGDRVSFLTALQMYEATIKGRRVRIDIADHEGDRRRGGQRPNRERDNNYDSERSSSDWRAGPRVEYSSNEDKRGSLNRRDYGFRDRDGFRERDKDRDRDRGERERDGLDRGRSFGDGWRDSDRRFSNEREYRSNYGNRRNYDERDSNNAEPKTRRKLNLKPRTLPIEEIVVKEAPAVKKPEQPAEAERSSAPSAASIFGQAKPVDTAAREREIEERLAKEREFGRGEKDSERARPRSEDYVGETRKAEPAPETKENPWCESSERNDSVNCSSQEINNGQLSDSEDTHYDRENDGDSVRNIDDESESLDHKRGEENEDERSDNENQYGRHSKCENRYSDKNREIERSHRRDDKYRGDDRDKKEKDRRDYDRRDRGYESEDKGREQAGKYRDQDRERDTDNKRYCSDRDTESRRYNNDKEMDSRKPTSEWDADVKQSQEKEANRYKEPDDHGSKAQKSDKRGSASGDRSTRQGRSIAEKDRLVQAKDRSKESKKAEDIPRMPKFKEAAAPNYVGTNKYCCLQEDGASE